LGNRLEVQPLGPKHCNESKPGIRLPAADISPPSSE
jgi:hypothetical protein